MSDPLVSISCTTFNHEPYIRQCLEGFLMQQCNFKYEILINDDASTDGTQEIIKEYREKYPEIIKPNFQTENQYSKGVRGMMPRFNFPRAIGKYIALCEGDDYWTDPLKLQKQVDFLEANPDYALCFHPIKILKPDGTLVDDFITKVPENYELRENLASGDNYIHTPSVIFRNVIEKYPPELGQSTIGDYFLYIILTEKGKIKMLEDSMAVYRFGVGAFSTLSQTKKAIDGFKLNSLILSYSSSQQLNQIFLEKQFKGLENFENLLRSQNTGLFNSNHIFYRIITSLKELKTIWGKIKRRF